MKQIDGIRKLKKAMLIYFFSFILSILFIFFSFIFSYKSTLTILFVITFFMVSIIVNILALLKIHFGFKILKNNNKSYNIGAIGAVIQIIGIIFTSIIFDVVYLSIISSDFIVFIILLISFVITVIGSILVGIALWNIGSEYKRNKIKVGAVFYIIINIIGILLLYFEFKKILDKKKK